MTERTSNAVNDLRYTCIVCYENGLRHGTYTVRDRAGIDSFIARNRQHEYIIGFIVIDVDSGDREVIENDG